MKPFVLILPAVLLLATSCGRPDSQPSSGEPGEEEQQFVREAGEKASNALTQRLGGLLKSNLKIGGPVQAIKICQQVALPQTVSTDAEFTGVSLRRTTLKPRNPANSPDELDRAVLTKMAVEIEGSSKPPQPVIEWQNDIARYYHPLVIQEVCLNCHGNPDHFPADLAATLATLYPADEATGYSLGDLRGVIRVDVTRK